MNVLMMVNYIQAKTEKIGYISQGIDERKTIMNLFDWNNRREQGEIRTKLNLVEFSDDRLNDKVECLSLGKRMKLKYFL